MRESMGSVFLYNIIFVFLAIVFSFLMGTLIYHKAFTLNSSIIASLEKFEGYNKYSIQEIDRHLTSIGYPSEKTRNCPQSKGGGTLSAPESKSYDYCIYLIDNDGTVGNTRYYSYGVITYISFDFPIISSLLKIPIYTQSNRIYKFN